MMMRVGPDDDEGRPTMSKAGVRVRPRRSESHAAGRRASPSRPRAQRVAGRADSGRSPERGGGWLGLVRCRGSGRAVDGAPLGARDRRRLIRPQPPPPPLPPFPPPPPPGGGPPPPAPPPPP